MASRVAAALCLLSIAARIEAGDGPEFPPAFVATRPARNLEQERQSRYLKDLTQIKNATLESESVFFDRLEKEKKIEDVRQEVTSAAQKLKDVRLKLSPPEVGLLEKAAQAIEQAGEPLDATGKFITAAQTELRRFHEASTPEAVAIAAGKSDAAPLAGRVRRLIKGAQRSMRDSVQHLKGSLSAPGGQRLLEDARAVLKTRLESLKEDDPQRAMLAECDKKLVAAEDSLNKAIALGAALLERLEVTQREYLPDCADTDGPALAPATKNSGDWTRNSLQPGDCHGASLAILQKSLPAVDAVQATSELLANIEATLGRVKEQTAAAVECLEQADALVHPDHAKVRELDSKAAELLDRAESQLSDMRHLLVEDVPGETKPCDCCGKQVVRTRKVLDPACVCAKANAAMREIEDAIRQASRHAEQMSEILGPIPEEELTRRTSPLDQARQDVGGPKGVLDELKLALQRGEQYRKQQFDIYPGESSPPTIQEMPQRAFPPMLTTYVARQSWHYPLYFEDISAERYGHHFGCVQPIVSYGKFLADLAMLPYNICLDPPYTIQYDLGLPRPGDDVPHLIYLPRWDCKAAVFEAGVWTGIMFTP